MRFFRSFPSSVVLFPTCLSSFLSLWKRLLARLVIGCVDMHIPLTRLDG